MKLEITYRHVSESLHQEVSEEFHELAARYLDRHVTHFPSNLVRLRIVAEEDKHHSNVRKVGLRLGIPSRQLTSDKTADSLLKAAKSAFADLERQLIEHLERIRGEDQWGRPKRREQLRRLRAAVADRSPVERETFRRAIGPHLSSLRHFARFELAHLRARGRLMSDYPSVDDLIDEVLARAFRDPDLLRGSEKAAPKLFRIAIDVAKEAAAHERSRRQMLSLEAPPPRAPKDIEIDETFYDFFQPDNLTKVEDLAADASSDPEEIASRKEVQRLLASLFASMPAEWRRAVILTRVGDLPPSTVAQVLNTTESEVDVWLDRADNFLRARLHDEGIVPSDIDQLSFLAKTPFLEASEMEAGFDEALENESPD